MVIESLQNRIKELETELSTFRQIAESTQQENESLKTMLKTLEANSDNDAETTAKIAEYESEL